MTVNTEVDGTEIDEDTFSAFNPGSTFTCAVGNENWSPSTHQEERNIPGILSSSTEEKTIQTSDTVTVAHTAKVGTLSFSLFFSSKDSTCSTPEVPEVEKEEEEVADTEELWCHCQEPEYGYISIIY